METRSKRKLRGPLPGGDRRGTPGADAGCFSMRTVSGEGLSRRAPTIQITATAEYSDDIDQTSNRIDSPIEPYSPSTISYTPSVASSLPSPSSSIVTTNPTLNVAREAFAFLPASTKAGKPRVRMRWSKEVNTFIMRTYYLITNLETDLTAYRQKLHEHFSRRFPEINVTEQRISDQRRTIIKNKLLSQHDLDLLKEEVRQQLQVHLSNNENINNNTQQELTQSQYQSQYETHTLLSHRSHLNTQITQTSHICTQTESITLTLENDIEIVDHSPLVESYAQELEDKFKTALTLYSGMDPANRPKLPKLKYNPLLTKMITTFNQNILNRFLSHDTQLIDLHTIVYCTALVISEELKYKIGEQTTTHMYKAKPAWQHRLEKDIEKLRADCGRLTQYIKGNRSNKVVKRIEYILKNITTHTRHESNNKTPEEFLDTLKQKLSLKVHRLRRYKKAQKRKDDNSLFATNEKKFYRNLQQNQTLNVSENNKDIPTKDQLESFWADIWEDQVLHNVSATWIAEEENRWNSIEEMEFTEVNEIDISLITSKLHNWKAPGIDKIHNFWYKKLITLHKYIAKNISEILLGKQNIPAFIATGITYMIPKAEYSHQPSQYRPITCLPTIYKIITTVIARKINKHIEHYKIIAEEQKGCRRGHMGCKEQLIIDSTIHKHATVNNRNLHCTYIDYQKAFDSIPHSWLIKILQIYKINPKIIEFLCNVKSHWKTSLQLTCHRNTITTRQITIKKGIYQGDSLSPLWFCLALNPLSHLLNSRRAGYCLKNNLEQTIISHLIYMDDIKLYAKTEIDMKKLIDTTTQFSKDINMKFGLEKCKTLHIIKGKIKPGDYTDNSENLITALEPTDFYKYLGYKQLKGLNHTTIKQTLKSEYNRRTNILCKSQLSAKHLIKALNTYAIPILTYSFGVIKWTKTDIQQIERVTRTTLTKHNNLHPKSAIERLTIKRQNGGRGLIDINNLWQKQLT